METEKSEGEEVRERRTERESEREPRSGQTSKHCFAAQYAPTARAMSNESIVSGG